MTNAALPPGSHGAEGDSEKKKWGHKREQFAAVISKTRLNGVIDRLVDGTTNVKALLAVLDELNGSNQQGRYMAEMLALKQESRKIAMLPFSPAVAEFLLEGSKRIPWLSDGLASQMAVTLAAAADNHEYLDAVNTAVGSLLVDLEHPLKPDTRNYLRALTDKIDATRRLQQARSHLAAVPSVYPAPIDVVATPSPPPVAVTLSPAKAEAEPLPRFSDEAFDGLPSQLPAPSSEILPVEVATPSPLPVEAEPLPRFSEDAFEGLPSQLPPPSREIREPVVAVPVASATKTLMMQSVPVPPPAPVPSAPPAPVAVPQAQVAPIAAPPPVEEEPLQIPTRPLPWKILLGSLGAVTLLGLGAYAYLRTTPKAPAPSPSAVSSVRAAPHAAASAVPEAGKSHRSKRLAKAAAEATRAAAEQKPVPTAKNATLAEVRAMATAPQVLAEPKPVVPTRPVEAKPVAPTRPVETKPVEAKPVVPSRPVETKPVVPSRPVETKPVEAPVETKPVPRTPTPVKDIDQILAELSQVPNDVARIEATAHKVSRIVARSAKPEAEKILARMTPEELLFGKESYDTRALEPLRRVVALTLQKVAVDKDDARAAQAIEMLGQWAKSRKHGGAAKLTLDQLAEEPVVLSRAIRRQALERVQQRLGMTLEPSE